MRKPKMTETIAAVAAPEMGDGSQAATETTTVVVESKKKANHELLDANGAVVDNEEAATGIRYTLLANNAVFDYQSGMTPGTRETMLVVFGAKTLCTNETSAMRNNPKGEASADDQMEAVRERFALLQTGAWVDRSREGVGAKVDLDALAEAICRVLVAEDKKSQADVDGGYKATVRQKLDDDKTYARKTRAYPPVAVQYAAIVGRATSSVDDLMA